MDEECETVARQHDVWLARQIPTMEPEAQTVPVQESPHVDFWPRIARSDPLHIELALRRREDIGHPYVRPQLRLPRRRVRRNSRCSVVKSHVLTFDSSCS